MCNQRSPRGARRRGDNEESHCGSGKILTGVTVRWWMRKVQPSHALSRPSNTPLSASAAVWRQPSRRSGGARHLSRDRASSDRRSGWRHGLAKRLRTLTRGWAERDDQLADRDPVRLRVARWRRGGLQGGSSHRRQRRQERDRQDHACWRLLCRRWDRLVWTPDSRHRHLVAARGPRRSGGRLVGQHLHR